MSLPPSVWRALELAECCTPEADVPRELKEAVQYIIAAGMAHIQPVFAVLYPGPVREVVITTQKTKTGVKVTHSLGRPREGQLFSDRPLILSGDAGNITNPELRKEFMKRVRFRLLLKPQGEAMLVGRRLSTQDTGSDIIDQMRAAIAKKGAKAKANALIAEARVRKQEGLAVLRKLEAQGEYHGFSKPRPARYKSS